MSFGGIYLTNVGRAALAKVQAMAATLNFERFAFGDGQLGGGLEIERTSLISEKDSQPITKLRVNGDNTVTVGTKRPGDAVGGYWFRELGLFITDPDNSANEILYAYANAGGSAQYIPAAEGAEIVEKTINIIASISNTVNVTATVTTGVYVTPEELAEEVARLQLKIVAEGILMGDGDGGVSAAQAGTHYALPASDKTASLSTSWTGSSAPYTQEVVIAGLLSTDKIVVGLASSITAAQYAEAVAAQLLCTSQAAGKITVTAFGNCPSVAIPIIVRVVG